MERLAYFNNYIAIILNLANKGKNLHLMLHRVDTNVNRSDPMDRTSKTNYNSVSSA